MTPLEVYDKHQSAWSDIGLHLKWLREHSSGKVLEIGTRGGISTSALITGIHDHGGHLWSVDLEDCSKLYDDRDAWTFVQANSHTDSDRILDLMGRQDNDFRMDLLLLDGDHSYSGCISDLTNFAPWSKTIAIHDTNSEFVGVWEAVISYFRSAHIEPFKHAEFFNHSNGMGVLYR